ncbi:hypothetical protein LVJ94_07150 [Pendulispora rubella]|uniref:Uncharacterized protein n=1 Tax=Pendulispora rubella TaxID=2741070 RepID=A0ABZ2L7Z5_9BACT
MAFLPPSALVQAVAPFVSSALVSLPASARIGAHTARLPPVFAWGIFECRLAPDDMRVDMLFRVSRRGGGEDKLAEEWPRIEAELGPIAEFLRAWRDPNGALARSPLFWVEHDLLPGGPSAPFVQFCVDPRYPEGRAALPPAELRALAKAGVAPLLGDEPDAGPLDLLAQCAARLPENASVLHVGVMPYRGRRDLRVLAGVPIARTWEWLAAIGWPGDRAHAFDWLDLLGGHFTHASVQLDLGEAVRPTLALEFPLPRSGDDPAWKRFMAGLVARGLADVEKAESALRWIGDATGQVTGAPWLVHVQRQLDVKLVLRADGTCEAKAYLCFHPRFVLF